MQLWSVGSPHLYTLVSEVQSGGKVSDSVNTSIGIRSIKFTGDGGFFVSHEVTIRLSTCAGSIPVGIGTARVAPDASAPTGTSVRVSSTR